MMAARIRAARPERAASGDRGFTLVELLVAMSLFLVLSGIVLSAVVTLAKGLDQTRVSSDVTAEARVALERIAREVRQANALANPTSSSVTVKVDFDGDGTIGGSLADPEIVTYAFDAGTNSISMTADDGSGGTATQALLAGQVTSLAFTYTSSNWAKDANGDGTVTLAEAGPDGPDQVGISLVVQRDGRVENFKSHVTLRNRSQS
jgi:prepilin-type N-terminal cleavage/methylation domain-containing protein